MSYEPLIFIKSFNERLEYFNCVFHSSLKACEIKSVWSSYIELSMMNRPTPLEAIWKMSKEFCNEHELSFPCTVVICVEDVNHAEQSCSVSITKVEDNSIHFPDTVNDVPLVELYPTKEKDADIAELLDSIRFFYNHLWMPWDSDVDLEDNSPWVDSHLKGRLELCYSMMKGEVPLDIIYSVHQLQFEARRVAFQLLEIRQMAMSGKMYMDDMAPRQALEMMKLIHKLHSLKNQFQIYETPFFLKAFIESKRNNEKLQQKSETYLVLPVTTCEHLEKYSQLLKPLISANETMRIVPTPQDALMKDCTRNRVFLSGGQHHFFDSSDHIYALEASGTIAGLEPGVVLTGSCYFFVTKELLTFSSLTMRLTDNLTCIKVRPGAECRLEDVKMEGSHVIDGVDVYANATLTAVNCLFDSFDTPVICDSKSAVRLINCTFTNNKVALKLNANTNFTMENCTFSGSKLYAIVVTVPRPSLADCTNVNTINSIPNMREENSVFIQNKKDLHFEPLEPTEEDASM